MFTLVLLAINVATLALGLIGIGEQSNKPKDKDAHNDRHDYPCA